VDEGIFCFDDRARSRVSRWLIVINTAQSGIIPENSSLEPWVQEATLDKGYGYGGHMLTSGDMETWRYGDRSD